MDFKETIIKRRGELKLSLREAAIKIGISHTYLSALEKGVDSRGLKTNKPTPDTLKLISKGYGLNYEYLMELCNYIDENETSEDITNPDIRTIARAGRKLNDEQARHLLKYAEMMFPEAFNDNKD